MGYYASPSFVDLDGDGDLDAFIGENNGNTLFFQNTGTTGAPSFATRLFNPFGLAAVRNYSSPSFADIDGDGDLDALIGSSDGLTSFFENLEFDGNTTWDGGSWGGGEPGPDTDVLILGGYDTGQQGGFDCSTLRVGQEGLLLIGTGGTIRVGGQ